jgi:high-affinity nickel-transport protein
LLACLIALNALAWLWAVAAFHGQPALLATALLAWVFGLRHAVDADHIAAIDNVVRKLMQQSRGAASVGLWFSLGHSTVVVLASAAIIWATPALQARLAAWPRFGSVVGTCVSAAFLLGMACVNFWVLLDVWRLMRSVRRGEPGKQAVIPESLSGGGLIARIFRPVFGLIRRPWQMYPVGFLFGLGFDTATEVGLLGLSAAQAAHGLAPWRAIVLPILFTAGMALVDSADCVLMVGAYGWAVFDPLRKLRYNLVVTAVSMMVAVVIGGIETIGLLSDEGALRGAFWQAVSRLNERFSALGLGAIGVFAFCWVLSALLFRYRRDDQLAGL